MKYYKLTNQDMKTHGGFQWELHKQYKIDKVLQGKNRPLCSTSWFHCYNHPLLAVLFNPIHSNFLNLRLFEVEIGGFCKEDKGLKFGFTAMKLVKEIAVPKISNQQKIAFSILCAKEISKNKTWIIWGDNWLKGIDRSAAYAAAAYAGADAGAAAYATGAAYAGAAAYDGAGAGAAAACAYAGAAAATDAYAANNKVNLIKNANKAMRY